MSTLWLHDNYAKIRAYSASVKGPKAVVKVEIEVSDPGWLGYFLENLREAQKELEAKERARPSRARNKAPQVEQDVRLQIPYFGEKS